MEKEGIVNRIEKIMDYYELSAAVFSDKIGVPRSSISHLLKGRNKPSLEFIMKVVETYDEVNLYWLLYGKGEFPKRERSDLKPTTTSQNILENTVNPKERKLIDRIVIFFNDGTFQEYQKN
ncbi:helix-turn-helix transcriptional regulator [Maribacter sp. PR1]|uniref:Helix-turn-helix transcriptional regulator n=1 Tax=Maribacter cobaltidurans TaxID=1178778 RepID=A0ABU7ITP0_9FLAO|nr:MULTISPECIES: helix-turn-helix transcriptional regulator [Maribacter]MDC6388604.1 helix-turn-helix transcriptional regulator [Maribacter sp. PR1]MEE1975993.1 helix-turn-helix transcriptional regulator [Maribacter cobaltidurans]